MLTEEEIVWSPPDGVNTHAGLPIEPVMDFFVSPPSEIGEILNASTTLRRDRHPLSPMARMAILFVPGCTAIAVLPLLQVENAALWGTGLFVTLFGIGWYLTRFAHTCTYVGKDGVSRAHCRGSRMRIVRDEVFLFHDAAELRTSETRHYHNGVYTGTNYHFNWTNEAGQKVFTLSGTYRGEKKPPKPKDPYHFAQSAEQAWSLYLLDHAQEQLEKQGAIMFRLSGSDWVAVGPGFLELNLKGQSERFPVEEIGGISIGNGVFKVKRKDAKEGWFSSHGVFQFAYGSMANAKLFLFACNRLLGYQFS